MSGFSIDWLDLREAADQRARDKGLLNRVHQWLQEAGEPTAPLIVDLGAGTGSTLRAFDHFLANSDPALTADGDSAQAVPFSWRLVDHDPQLLAEAASRHGGQRQLETCCRDFAQPEALPLDGARLVTASALFDLVSDDFIDTLAGQVLSRETGTTGVYAALNYDGNTRWTPHHPLDDQVLLAFNRDQRRDKGMGPALGPDATAALVRAFERAGFQVLTADSPWLLNGTDEKDSALVSALITGIHGAVESDSELESAALEDWRQFRLKNVTTGTCEIGHSDFLALPATAGDAQLAQ